MAYMLNRPNCLVERNRPFSDTVASLESNKHIHPHSRILSTQNSFTFAPNSSRADLSENKDPLLSHPPSPQTHRDLVSKRGPLGTKIVASMKTLGKKIEWKVSISAFSLLEPRFLDHGSLFSTHHPMKIRPVPEKSRFSSLSFTSRASISRPRVVIFNSSPHENSTRARKIEILEPRFHSESPKRER